MLRLHELVEARHALWPTLSAMGQPAAAMTHIMQGLRLADRQGARVARSCMRVTMRACVAATIWR
jgi:hypothetical protein